VKVALYVKEPAESHFHGLFELVAEWPEREWRERQWPQLTVNFSHAPTRVASEWMVSVVPAAAAHGGEVMPVDRLDVVHAAPEGVQREQLPGLDLRGIRVDHVGGPPAPPTAVR
jgi:hypothetical protein